MQSQQNSSFQTRRKDHFARLFPELPPLEVSDDKLWTLAQSMVDGGDWNAPAASPLVTNGLNIFGQFLAHDVSFEPASRLSGFNEIAAFQNDRTLNLDLDCLYGQRTQDFYYDAEDTDKLLQGECYSEGVFSWRDLPRNSQGKAIIPDSRNDENIVVSRMQALFIQFHNAMVDHLRCIGRYGNIFEEAKRETIWHYQWLIVHEYLKKMMEPEIFRRLMQEGPRFYVQPTPLPLEFSGAVFRVGHSQTPDAIRINDTAEKKLFELGFFTVMKEFVDWRYFFDFKDGRVQFARLIDTKIGRSFHNIPFVKSADKRERSLPFRNMKRGVAYGLPSGEWVARRLGYDPIEVLETMRLQMEGTPLWYYVLKEAETLNQGKYLGPVGSVILGEVFMTIMLCDDLSWLKIYPRWKPEIGRRRGEFDFVDMIAFAEADMVKDFKKNP